MRQASILKQHAPLQSRTSANARPNRLFLHDGCRLLLWGTLFLFLSAFLDTAAGLNQKGNRLYKEKRYQSALETYRKAQVKAPKQPEILYNLGTTFYQTEQFDNAAKALQNASDNQSTNKPLLAQSWYNYGNALYRLGRFDQAIEAYKKTLELDPKDKDAKYNLELLLKKKSLFEKKQDQRDQNRKEQKEQKSKNQQSQGGGGQMGKDKNQSSESKQQEQKQESDSKKEPASEQPKQTEQEQKEQKQPQPSEQPQSQEQESEPNQQPDKQKDLAEQPKEEASDRYYQGQMSKTDAYRILDALRESEKELQLLKQPKTPGNFEKQGRDW